MGASGDGGTGGGSFEGYPEYDAESHLEDIRGGYGFKKDTHSVNDPYEVLAQLNRDIDHATALRIAQLVGDAIDMHPSVDISTVENNARMQVVDELNEWSTAVRINEGTYHD
jgi:hypothetical protein